MTFVGTMTKTKAKTKDERIYIRVTEKVRDDFDIIAEHKGLNRSALLHSMIVKMIFDTRNEMPFLFENSDKKYSIPEISIDEAKADNERKKGKKK